jgi:uncharacterized protein YtpQ (UPF0354 family)
LPGVPYARSLIFKTVSTDLSWQILSLEKIYLVRRVQLHCYHPSTTKGAMRMDAGTVISLEAFTDEFVDRCVRKSPDAHVVVIGPGDVLAFQGEQRVQVNVTNAYATYAASPDRLDQELDKFVAVQLQALEVVHSKADLSRVMPVFKNREMFDGATAMSKKHGIPASDLYEPWPGDMVMLYAIDDEHSLRMLMMKSELKELGCTLEELRVAAEANISKRVPHFKVVQGDDMVMLTYDGTYEVSLLAATHFWESNALRLRGNALVYCPSRDVLVVADGASKAAEERLFEMANDPTPPPGGYPVSRQIMQFRLGKFHLYHQR